MPHTLQTEDGQRTRIVPGDILLFRPQQGCISIFRPQNSGQAGSPLSFSLVPTDRSGTYFPFKHGIVPNAETYFQLLQAVTGLELVQNRTTAVRDSPCLEYTFRKSDHPLLFAGNTKTSFRPGDAVVIDMPSNSLFFIRMLRHRNGCILTMRTLQSDVPSTVLKVVDLSDWKLIVETIAFATGHDMERSPDGVMWTARVPTP